jgi:hypothetical protein
LGSRKHLNFQLEQTMAARVFSKIQPVGGIIVLLCGIAMVIVQLDGSVRLGEKPGLSSVFVAVVFLCLGAVLMALNRRRKVPNYKDP